MKRIMRRIIAWTAVLFIMIFSCAVVYGEEYYDLRNGDISLVLPDNWVYNESEPEESEGLPYEMIAQAFCDDEDAVPLCVDIFFMSESIPHNESYYIDEGEEEALRYYEKYGRETLETLYNNVGWTTSVTIGEPEYYSSQWNSFLVVPVSGMDIEGDSYSDIVYLTCGMIYGDEEETIVHRILTFYNDEGKVLTAEDLETVKRIADDFYDYGYYEEPLFGGAFGEDTDGFSVILGIMCTAISVLVAGIGIVNNLKKKLEWKREGKPKQPPKRKDKMKPEKVKKFTTKVSHDHIGDIVRKNQIDRKDGRRTSTSEERYMESLRTLRKSGLLTREEMQDMLERHERNISYRRRR